MNAAIRTALTVAGGVVLLANAFPRVHAQPARMEYRVVFAAPRELQRRVDEAGRDGFACVAVARPEPDVSLPGVVVILGRSASPTVSPVAHRGIPPGGRGSGIGPQIDQSGSEGYRLCGIAFADASPIPTVVAVMSRRSDSDPVPWHYTMQLTNRQGITALAASAKEGFTPVFASPVGDNRVPEMRSWTLVAEKSSTSTLPIDFAIRSAPGPDGLQKAINEQSGYHADLLWKEGNSIVVVMSRSSASPTVRPEYIVDAIDPSRLDTVSGWYVGDVPYLSDGQRVVVRGRDISASNAVVEDRLPSLGTLEYADTYAMRPLGEHLARNNYRLIFSSVRRGARGGLSLHTVLTRFSQ